ncbi:glycoside hydrolase family 15 [archaeon]|nr:glycoside hydrolase family 15 [archaeon]MBL7057647.1 glycoside hydrolase family 15 [Candidatus Woesearchaeota archaeon]
MPKKLNYDKLIKQHLKILKSLQYRSGLFAASNKKVSTGYNKSWLRDNFYECLAFEFVDDWQTVEKTYGALLKVFLMHEEKIDWAIEKRPEYKHEYIHARINPKTFEEFWEDWGNKQNDSVGAILFRIGRLEHHHKRSILKNKNHFRIVNKLVKYLESIQYWHDMDSGMWEENEEIHSSSVGACVAGLIAVSKLPNINVPPSLIKRGKDSLQRLLPRESEKKFVDLAQLSLIWPYRVVTAKQRDDILEDVEYHLVKKRGVIRYKNDYYYNNNPDGYSEEAEWTFGLSWLAIIYEKLGQKKKAKEFIDKMLKTQTKQGIPELYFSNTPKPNENNPLGWSESLFIVALYNYNKKFMKK